MFLQSNNFLYLTVSEIEPGQDIIGQGHYGMINSQIQGWGQILEKGFKSKSKSFEFFQIQIKSKSFLFQKDLNPNPNPF